MTLRSRTRTGGLLHDAVRQNPINFQTEDPDDFYVKDTTTAGYGLFANRFFLKGEFLLNYRGERKYEANEDSVYVFDSGKPENIKIDATHCSDCLGRYINDIDCFKTANCHPVKHRTDEGEVLIAFFSTRNIEKDEELRYAYNSCYAPWRKPASFRNSKVDKLSNRSEDVKPSQNRKAVLKSKPSEKVKPSLHGEPSQSEPSPESGDVKELETGERKLDSDDMNKSIVGEINQLESVNKCEVEQKSNTGESEEVQVREVGRKEEQNLKTVEVNEVKVDEVKVDEVKVNEVKVNEVEVNEFEMSEVEENEVEGNEIEVGLEARVKSANFGGHNNSESQQSDQVAVDLFDEFNLGGCEDAVDLDLIDVSGNLNLESPEEGNRSDSESCSSSEKSDDEHSMDVSLFSDTSRNSNTKPKRPLFEQCLLCDKSVRKMRDHLNYFHKLKSNPVLKTSYLLIILRSKQKNVTSVRTV